MGRGVKGKESAQDEYFKVCVLEKKTRAKATVEALTVPLNALGRNRVSRLFFNSFVVLTINVRQLSCTTFNCTLITAQNRRISEAREDLRAFCAVVWE